MLFEQVLAVEQRRRVGEGRQGHQLAVNGLRLDDRGEVLGDDILGGIGEVEELVGKLRRPDHVGLIDVDIGIARCQPQAVLAELVGGGRGHRHHGHLLAGCGLELVELAAQERQAGAGIAGDNGQVGGLGRARHQRYAGHQADKHLLEHHLVSSRNIQNTGKMMQNDRARLRRSRALLPESALHSGIHQLFSKRFE